MRRVWWRWVTAEGEPEPRPPFDPSNLTAEIRDALDEDDPAVVIRARWPWVPGQIVVGFLIRLRFAGSDEAEDELVERFRRAVIAHSPDQHDRPPLWRRILRRKGN